MQAAPVFRSKNEQVYDLLKSKIVRGELKPGQPVVIDTLARELGVSQIPIREALRQLEGGGFVRIEPYVGARVTEIHAGSIHEVFSMLEHIEILSGRAACRTITPEGVELLAQIIAIMATQLDDPEAWSESNKHLHRFICRQAGMNLVEKMLLVALDHWDRLRCHYLEDVFARLMPRRQLEHEQMLDALRRRDPEELEHVIHAHNRESLRAYTAYLEQHHVLSPADQPGRGTIGTEEE